MYLKTYKYNHYSNLYNGGYMVTKVESTKDLLEANGIVIKPYLRGPTKQFLPNLKGLERIESSPSYSNFDNYSNYSNYQNFDNYSNFDNFSNFSSFMNWSSVSKNNVLKEAIRNGTRLSEIIQFRRDCQEFGFIHNLLNNTIYFANSKAIDLLEKLSKQNLTNIREKHPEILAVLQI